VNDESGGVGRRSRHRNIVEHFSYLCRVRRGPGGPRDSRPGGRRYLFFQRPATLSQTGDPLYTIRQNALMFLFGILVKDWEEEILG
jgi:hypothetical protein